MNRIICFINILLLSLTFSCATVNTEGNIQKAGAYYTIGVAYLNENKVQQAFVEFQRAYELDPQNKEVLYAIGIIYLLHFEETQMAIDFFQKAVAIDPDFSDAYNSLGIAHDKMFNYEAAIPFYKKAVSNLRYATPEKAYISMGNTYYRLRRFDEALAAYREAIKRAPSLSLTYFRIALCLNAQGRYGEASTAISQAINLDPTYKGDAKKAADDFTLKKITATGTDKQDFIDYLEILKY